MGDGFLPLVVLGGDISTPWGGFEGANAVTLHRSDGQRRRRRASW